MRRFIGWGVLLASLSASGAERLALLVGSRAGRADQAPLRYTGADVSRMQSVLVELGGFAATNVGRLETERAQDVLDTLAGFERERRGQPLDVFLFYYSGHGDSAGLQVGETGLPLEALLPAIRRVPAHLRVLVIDACQSGAATHRKGVIPGAPVEVRIDAKETLGEVIISSSSAGEESFESDSLAGAVFTVHWVSGLRGGADENGDGAITLSEAYRYAQGRTISSTLLSSGGPQRPTFRWDLTGRDEPVLATAGNAARLTLRATQPGSFFIFDGEEQDLIAELPSTQGQEKRVLLSAGRYVVRQRTAREVRSARVELQANDDHILNDAQMEGARLVRLARKGGLGQWSLTAHAGQFFSALGEDPFLQVGAGAALERGIVLVAIEGRYLSSGNRREGLTVLQRGGALTGSALFGLLLRNVTLRGGPSIGAVFVRQDVTGRPSVTGTLLMIGVELRLEVELTRSLAMVLTGRGETWWGPAREPLGRWTLPLGSTWAMFPSVGWALGLKAAF